MIQKIGVGGITIEGFWLKLIVCPVIVVAIDSITRDVFYGSWFLAVMVGLILAVVGHLLDMVILRRGTLWLSTVLDFFAAAAVVFFSQFFIYNTFITMAGALLIASVVAISEYLVHRWLIGTGRIEEAME